MYFEEHVKRSVLIIRMMPYVRWIDIIVKVNRKYFMHNYESSFFSLHDYQLIIDILKGDYEYEGT